MGEHDAGTGETQTELMLGRNAMYEQGNNQKQIFVVRRRNWNDYKMNDEFLVVQAANYFVLGFWKYS